MLRPHPAPGRRRGQYGFTMVEMIISLMVGSMVLAAVYQMLIVQSRAYGVQREVMEVQQTLRSAAALLAWEMRQAGGGDLYSIDTTSITLRSTQGGGTVCATHTTLQRFGVRWGGSGDVAATADDSLSVYMSTSLGVGSWKVGSIDQIMPDQATAGVAWCDWGDGASIAPDVVLEVTVEGLEVWLPGGWTQQDFGAFCISDALNSSQQTDCLAWGPDWPTFCPYWWQIEAECNAALAASEAANPPVLAGTGTFDVGTPFRVFRRVEYGLYLDAGDGRWWLGRKVGAAAFYEKLTGPLLAPASGGLVFTYRDTAGNVTADPTQVATIEFVLRAESYRPSGNTFAFQQDSVAMRVALRN